MTPEEIRQLQHLVQQQQEQQRQQFQQHLASEEEKLLDAIPAWRADPELAKKEMGEIRQHMVEHHGYTDQEMAIIGDHRHVLTMRELHNAHQRETEAKRRAAEDKRQREARQRAEADKAAEKRQRLDEAKKNSRKHHLSSHAQAEALADALGEE
jgi:hypothetical protein